MVHLIEAVIVGALGATVVLVFAARNNPRIAAWVIGTKLPGAK